MEVIKIKDVWTIVGNDREAKWTKIGIGFINQDGSINVILDCIPSNGRIQIRDRVAPTNQKGVVG